MIRKREDDDDNDNDDNSDHNQYNSDDNDNSEFVKIGNKYDGDGVSNNDKNDRKRSKIRGRNKIKVEVKKVSIEEAAGSMSVSVDPYTYSLLRYSSAKSYKRACESSCPLGPRSFQNSPKLEWERRKKNYSTENRIRHFESSTNSICNNENNYEKNNQNNSKNNKSLSDNSGMRGTRSVRVGYISYDCRSHPMGRLTKALLTTHNESKVR